MCSTTSPIRSVSRAALASASVGVSSALASRWRGRMRGSSAATSRISLSHSVAIGPASGIITVQRIRL